MNECRHPTRSTRRLPPAGPILGALGGLCALVLAGCGGGEADSGAASASVTPVVMEQAQKAGNDCIGSCTGGGGTPVVGATNPLPTTAPAPGYLVRESFGPGPQQLRPKGGKGDMRSAFLHTTLGGFWVEWPGNKSNAWITPNGDQTWKFAGAGGNPYELPSPLQPNEMFDGVAFSELFDVVNPVYPTALLPISLPAKPWALSIEGYPTHNVPFDSYIGLGLTDNAATLSNLTSVAKVSLLLKARADGLGLDWQLWQGGLNRTLLAQGWTDDYTYNHLELAYDPATQLLSGNVNGQSIGVHPMVLSSARYGAFEGLGLVDNFVLRDTTLAPCIVCVAP